MRGPDLGPVPPVDQLQSRDGLDRERFRAESAYVKPVAEMETGLAIEGLNGRHRFGALLSGAAEAIYDQLLLERGDWLIAPTLGAVISGWVLALPRMRVLSFRDWTAAGGQPAPAVLAEVQSHLGLKANEIIWFEHGPSRAGTLVGCGLDHAHLHILIRPPFDFAQLSELARSSSELQWFEEPASNAYRSVEGQASYCIAGSGDWAISASHVEGVGSQFFRRLVAALTDNPSSWDYRTAPHLDNIQSTVSTFRRLERARASVR